MKLTRPVHPNEGTISWYTSQLKRGVKSMVIKLSHMVRSSSTTAEVLAKVQSPSLAAELIAPFVEIAPALAGEFADKTAMISTRALRASLADEGLTVQFKPTPRMVSVVESAIEENVALITSLPEEHIAEVRQAVMESYLRGQDVHHIVRVLNERAGITGRRAELIARDQTNKLTAVSTRERRLELGLTRAIWLHSRGGKEPRPDHVAANGQEYDIAQGCLISGEYIQPGELINCRCSSRIILPTNGIMPL